MRAATHHSPAIPFLFSVALLLASAGPVAGQQASSTAHLTRVAEGRYDLEGRQQSLIEVLEALAEQEGFELIAPGLPPNPIRRDYNDITAERLLERLTEGLIVATEYARGGPPKRLKKVVVYPNTGAPELAAPARPRPAGTAGGSPELSAELSATLKGVNGIDQARRGMEQLAKQDSPESARALAEALDSEQPELRRAAISHLAGMRNDQAVQLLAQVLFSHEDADERLLAAEKLMNHASPEARALLSAATEDDDPRVKALAEAAEAAQEK